MSKTWKFILAGAFLAGLSGTAAAGSHVGFAVSVGGPGYGFTYADPAPVYYAPPPAYYTPPAYYAPAPAYYRPRAYYAPAPVVVYPRHFYGHRWHHGRRW